MESTRYDLIELLKRFEDEYVSGQWLSERLSISRSAIWKHMNELKKDGYKIESIPSRGYRILQLPDKLSENTVKWDLHTNWLGNKIIHKTTVDSTQSIAHQEAHNQAEHGTVIIADEQKDGRGRMGRYWASTKHKGIWMSVILRPNISPAAAPQMTLMTATVLADVLAEQTSIKPTIKWPNDLLINQKKAAGILTEMQAEQDKIRYIIVGIGMNINQTSSDFPDHLKNEVTSLKLESKEEISIVSLIQHILRSFEQTYDAFIENGFSKIKHKWEAYAYRIGERINVQTSHTSIEGIFVGIANDGALLVQTKSFDIKKIYSGTIEWLI